jgi:hypothetical protein
MPLSLILVLPAHGSEALGINGYFTTKPYTLYNRVQFVLNSVTGLLNWRVSKPHGKDGEGKDLPYVTQCVLLFESSEKMDKAIEKHGEEIFGDIPNFSQKGQVFETIVRAIDKADCNRPFTFRGDVTGEM